MNGLKGEAVNDMEIVEKVFQNIGSPKTDEAYCKAVLLEAIRLTRIDCAQTLAKNKGAASHGPQVGQDRSER